MLYDSNKIPYHLAPPNAVFGWMVTAGMIAPQDRDFRHLRVLRRALLPRRWTGFYDSPSLMLFAGQLQPWLVL